jgi:D-alanyl-D-alanine carboxypeptidase
MLRSALRSMRAGFSVNQLALLLIVLFLFNSSIQAHAHSSASIVVDGNTGKVLEESKADELRYPASITKVMTLYLLFEEMEKGHLNLNSKLQVSEFAASRPPSKLGLRPGDDILVHDAILAVVTRSANDVAVTIAENIAGSESAFAALMTKKARQLGMNNTNYKNASGLPDMGQTTTARDLALLGRSIYERFPVYVKYFSTRAYNYKGHMIGNHNKLLGRVNGVDGIKTGYTNASGYNLLTSVHHNGRHLVAVVMGGATGPRRDATMRMLIASYLPRASHQKVADKQLIARVFGNEQKIIPVSLSSDDKEKKKPSKSDTTFAEAAEVIERASGKTAIAALAPASQSPHGKKNFLDIVTPALAASEDDDEADNTEASQQAERLALNSNANEGEFSPAYKAEESNNAGSKDVVTASLTSENKSRAFGATASGWVVQIAATNSQSEAMKMLNEARTKLKLSSLQPFTERVEKGETTFFRARFGGFTERKTAEAACSALKHKSYDCLTLRL